jgi:hypothetical protein
MMFKLFYFWKLYVHLFIEWKKSIAGLILTAGATPVVGGANRKS